MSYAGAKVKYGLSWNTANDLNIELAMIRWWGYREVQGKKHGMGLTYHVIEAQKLLWPDKQWHRWNRDLIIPELCKGGICAIFGPGSSGKSHEISDFVLTLYFAFPRGFTCLMSTTTSDMLDYRIFGQAKLRFKEAKARHPWLHGTVVSSKHAIVTDTGEAEDRDFRDGIKGVACIQGGTYKGLGNYIGIKNSIMCLAADEVSLMGDGFLKACANLKLNPRFFGFFAGNLSDLDNPLAEAAEPALGWDSIKDTEESRVYKTKFSNGRAIQLIGTDSPNFDFPKGREPFPNIIGRDKIAEAVEDYGLDTPLYNMFAKGKIPRDTTENRIITELVCTKQEAYEPVTWGEGTLTKLYCADISYTIEHGDRTVGIPLHFGRDIAGNWVIALIEAPLTYSMEKGEGTPEEQIATLMQAECERFGIPPERVFYDGTGRSSFTSAVMRGWSTKVNAVEFGGPATNRPNFLGRKYKDSNEKKGAKKGDLMPCNEVFGKLVSEFWFAWRAAVDAGQVRGLSKEIVKDGHRRLWFLSPNNRTDVEPKKDMKKRTGRSPDLADAFCVGLEGARRLGFPLGKLESKAETPTARWQIEAAQKWEKMAMGKELEAAA